MYYITGILINQTDGLPRKNAKRKILSIAETRQEAERERERLKDVHGGKYLLRIYSGDWKQI